MCLSPKAAATNCHTPFDLKQQKFILSWFWSLEVQNQAVAGPLALKTLGENRLPVLM